jgi:hypothetical protein
MVFLLGRGCYYIIQDHPKVSNVRGNLKQKNCVGDCVRGQNLVAGKLEKICKLYLTAHKKYFTLFGLGVLDSVFYADSNEL